MVSCVICGQTKKHAYIHVNGATICTEDALEVIRVAERIGLKDMGVKLAAHHEMIVGGNTGA